jgi:quinol monooxygenase YgiN
MYQIIARWRAQDGKHLEVMNHVNEMAIATRKEPGNLKYDVYQNVENPHMILLDELYTSEEAAQAHRNSEHFQTIVEGKISPLLAARVSEKTVKN